MFNLRKKAAILSMTAVLAATAASSLTAQASDAAQGDTYQLSIVYNNDIHGRVDRLPQFKTLIDQAREECDNLLVLNGGDIFLRGEFQEQQGIPEMELLNAMGYDAWVLGNNDFRVPPKGGSIVQGNEQLQNLIGLAEFPTLCANVTMNNTGEYIDNADPYTIKEVGGLKVGIIGVTSLKPQDRDWKEVSDKTFESGEITVGKIIEEVKPQTDINIVLSHTGLAVDTKIANVEGISAVIGADDHYIITSPVYYPGDEGFKSTPILQGGGEQDQYLGRLDLTYIYDEGTWTLDDFNGYLYDLEGVEGNSEIQNLIDTYRAEASEDAA
ncbi:bifunctional metallophosphatase/5'-nucleotidase [Murimonas intestini]|uniref:5'-nucleotidase n=1 Tax=Murimonas intestini TaxID=1337051 RepID=A0AB73T1G5_9FIRM|nr:metallophosphoesterase [Murimonas intestini]MCR1840386.1 metallophosphoesterase [Murimonas intestini]MCR1867503.1 metallophosphoesterase [Murimonas intestini]MCR1884690.1 metallophosphoesterase [Murimonas intestini]